ncbi:MAG TPA: hypothetical protein VMM55_01335 [Thermohalobaculum sp.]|nr:hypothetical protein [Thermohalobaculum sp.]
MTILGGRALDPGLAGAARRARLEARAAGGRALLATAFAFSLILPGYFFVGPLRLSPLLLLLLASFPPLVLLWAGGRAGGVRLPDLMVLGAALWAALSLLVNEGVGQGWEPAGIVVLQTFGAYLIGRHGIRGPAAMARLALTGAVIVGLLLPFALYEALTGVALYLALFAELGPALAPIETPGRLGLDRAQAAFEHPILYGIFVSSTFALAWTALQHPASRMAVGLMIGLATFVSLSTGALLCLAVQIGLLAWGGLLRRLAARWLVLALLVLAGYATVDLLSNRTPFQVFASYLTLNPQSAFNRVLIWEHGSAEVLRNPLLGIGLGGWERAEWMPGSVDMFWLLIAMRHGLPAVALLGGAFLLLMWRAARRRDLDPVSARLRLGLIVSLVGVSTAIWSVHLWNASYCWMMFLAGCLGWLAEEEEACPRQGAPAGPAPPKTRRTWL